MSQEHGKQGFSALMLGAIGVVYGDIGTSPLYTVREVFHPATGVPLDDVHLIGAISTIFWALMLVVTLKYVLIILRADNRGEGGGLALTALAAQALQQRPMLRAAALLLGVFGATLFYGDSIITPAISVLGAMEGLELVTPTLTPYVMPLTLVILVLLFMVQRFGTSVVGRLFGPIIVVWFVVLGSIGIVHIVSEPSILQALNPMHAWQFLTTRGWHLFAAVGAIVLALTGAEALYADMGHFGRKPIQWAWTGLVLPCLALNYLGQGALLMHSPQALSNPFYLMFPQAWVLPVLILATLAAIIASQAVISGAYSMTRQAILLGYLPRMTIRYTSAQEFGQIYMPTVNWALLAGVVLAVLMFGSSSALAGAYGIAVTLTMMITTVLGCVVASRQWPVSLPLVLGAGAAFLAVDALLVAGCGVKFFDGGWFPLLLGLALFAIMSTWSRGRALVLQTIRQDGLDLQGFLDNLRPQEMARAHRTAVYAVADPSTVPQALLHNLKHYQVLHDRNLILTVRFHDVPWVQGEQRAQVQAITADFIRVTLNFGFMEVPDVPKALTSLGSVGLEVDVFDTSYFLSRETVVPTPGSGMAPWRETLFATMSRNAGGVVEFFRLPTNAVVELGTRIQI